MPLPQLPKEAVDICAEFVFGRRLRDQEKEKVICAEIIDGIRRMGKRGTDADLVITANKVVVGTCCVNKRQAVQELRMNLLEIENPYAPFETRFGPWLPTDIEFALDIEFAFQYRTRWRRFCAWTKGGPEVEKYPTRLLMQALMQGRL